jgi:hypothetical protein
VFLPDNNHIIQIQVLLYGLHTMFPAAKIQYVDHWQISLFHFGFFGAITHVTYKRRNELSNKAVTDFEIAKLLWLFLRILFIVVFSSPSSPKSLGTPFHIYYEYLSITDLFLCHAKLKTCTSKNIIHGEFSFLHTDQLKFYWGNLLHILIDSIQIRANL